MDQPREISLHPALARQLRRLNIAIDGQAPIPAAAVRDLLAKVDSYYRDAEDDRKLLEHSIDLSSREMEELNHSLETERNRLNTLLTAMEDCVCTLDAVGQILWGNPAALEMLGPPTASEISLPFFARLGPLTGDDSILPGGEKGARQGRALLETHSDGKIPISYLVSQIKSPREIYSTSASIASSVVVFRNISADLAREKELRDAREAAQAASRAKTELIANVSHEVRTPLHGILGLTQVLLLEGGLTDGQAGYLKHVQTSGESLLHVLNDILDLSKIEAGRLTLESIPFRADELLENVGVIASSQAKVKGLDLRCKTAETANAAVLGDPTRLRQILFNLTSNAVKFTERGFIALRLRFDTDETSAKLQFEVEDTGIGIAPSQQTAIFESYSQADRSITRRFGGTGLGLAICSRLASLMAGSLTVDSEPGHGSIFRLTLHLPLAAQSIASAPAAADTRLRPLHILYAEDNAINQLTCGKMLRSRGHKVDIVGDGLAAVEASGQGDYDVILMDHQMPKMGGVESCQAIRKLGCATPIIAASADAMIEDRNKFFAAGMQGFVGKPFTLSDLEKEIARVLAAAPVSGSGSNVSGLSCQRAALRAPSACLRRRCVSGCPKVA